jgi:ABC-2 type transport system permease protein
MSGFKSHWGVAKLGIKVWSTYRFEFIVGLLSVPVSLIIYYFLWKSVFSYTGQEIIGGFTLQQMVSYYVLSMIVSFFTWSEVDKWVEADLLHGRMVAGLLKPVSFISWYLSFEIGINVMNIIWQMIPVFIIGFIFFGLETAPFFYFIAFFISLAFAFLIYFGMTFILGLSAFWLTKITGLRRIRRVVLGFLGGSFVPLTFFPDWAQALFHYLPFENTKFVPITIYLGTLTKAGVIRALTIQLVWVVALFVVIFIIWRHAYKRFSSVGV